jgi:hypothetical protein
MRHIALYSTLPRIVSIPVENGLNGLCSSCPHQGKQLLTQLDHRLSCSDTPGIYLLVTIVTVLGANRAHPDDVANPIHHVTVCHREVDGRSVARAA